MRSLRHWRPIRRSRSIEAESPLDDQSSRRRREQRDPNSSKPVRAFLAEAGYLHHHSLLAHGMSQTCLKSKVMENVMSATSPPRLDVLAASAPASAVNLLRK